MKAASKSPRAAPKAHAKKTSMGRVRMVSGSCAANEPQSRQNVLAMADHVENVRGARRAIQQTAAHAVVDAGNDKGRECLHDVWRIEE